MTFAVTGVRAALVCALGFATAGCTERPSEPARAAAHAVPASADSSSPGAAADVVRHYYAAIDARDFRRAYVLWDGDGAASGRTFAAFAGGFANTAHVAVDLGAPGAIDAAAGSRYIEIPVTVRAITRDGAAQRFAGSYVLRRSEVDGATEAQRRWRFYSAKLREQPVSRP